MAIRKSRKEYRKEWMREKRGGIQRIKRKEEFIKQFPDYKSKFGRLKTQERAILTLYYGLDGTQPETGEKIAQALGISRQWAMKLKSDALKKLATSIDSL